MWSSGKVGNRVAPCSYCFRTTNGIRRKINRFCIGDARPDRSNRIYGATLIEPAILPG
jgi:hypothetical protein